MTQRKRNLALGNDAATFAEDGGCEKDLFPDHGVVLVVGVVGVPELAIRPELELKKLVAKLSLVTDVVAKIKLSIFLSCHFFPSIPLWVPLVQEYKTEKIALPSGRSRVSN